MCQVSLFPSRRVAGTRRFRADNHHRHHAESRVKLPFAAGLGVRVLLGGGDEQPARPGRLVWNLPHLYWAAGARPAPSAGGAHGPSERCGRPYRLPAPSCRPVDRWPTCPPVAARCPAQLRAVEPIMGQGLNSLRPLSAKAYALYTLLLSEVAWMLMLVRCTAHEGAPGPRSPHLVKPRFWPCEDHPLWLYH